METPEQGYKAVLELILQQATMHKDMTFETPELEVDMRRGAMIQIGLFAANVLDLHEIPEKKIETPSQRKINEDAEFCPRAVSSGGGPDSTFKPPFNGEMTWNDDDKCSYCGSLNPDVLMSRIETGDIEIGPTDKSYKIYVQNAAGEDFKQTYRDCPSDSDCTGPDDCTHWVTKETPSTKFYFQHLSKEQMMRFIELLNEKKIKIGYPGYFYTQPYFLQPKGELV